ncbi:MAG: ATP-binding protein [Candidatus Muiribacteriota bacterium]
MFDIIKRPFYLENIFKFVDKPIIKIITGMRRSGKSSILKMIIEEISVNNPKIKVIYINKESLRFDFIKDYKDLYKYVSEKSKDSNFKYYIFIDEIQEISEWEKAVSSFLTDNTGDLFLTGSNAHLLSSELSTLITGRYIEINVLPLGFTEFLDFRKKNSKNINIDIEFENYLQYGGLPGIHHMEFEKEVIYQYLNSLFDSILLKDVISRNNIRNVSVLKSITKFIFDNCGNLTTAKNISDFLKSQRINITVDTVQNYLSYLEEAFLVFSAKRYDIKGKRYLEFFSKYYMGDIGLRNGFVGYRNEDISGLLENVVYLELIRCGYVVSIGKKEELEVDFIAEKNGIKVYIQVCYMLNTKEVIEREFSVLEQISDNYPKFVISMDKINKVNRNGVFTINLLDFCLNKKFLD